MIKRDLTLAMLYDKLVYCPETSDFVWAKNGGSRARKGCIAGCARPDGYWHIGLYGYRYLKHHLVWLAETGEYPDVGIDHINGDPSDNRFVNLRVACQSNNLCNKNIQTNSTSGVKGVSWSKKDKRWMAETKKNGIRIRTAHKTLESAAKAYAQQAVILHKEYARVVDTRALQVA